MSGCNQLVYKKSLMVLSAAVISMAFGCKKPSQAEPTPSVTPEITSTPPEEYGSRSAWIIYWDNDIMPVLADENYDAVILFACYYREDETLYIPEQMQVLYDNTEPYEGMRYLSITNDVQMNDGTAEQKSSEFLAGLLEDKTKWNQRINDLINAANRFNANGIEIDFEKVDSSMYESYAEFLKQLCAAAEDQSMKMRVVLEYRMDTELLNLPEGPEYVVMCYNLYGYHSGPGPKADPSFLKKAADKFKNINGIGYGLANGGFEWSSGGKVIRSLTSAEAETLVKQKNTVPVRDQENMALSFQWLEDDGIHTVWYGDADTILYWKNVLDEYTGRDVSITLWRVENNRQSDK